MVCAQKSVLYQYDYFDALLDNATLRGASGPLKIRLKDLDTDILKHLVRLMHIRHLAAKLSTFQDKEANGDLGELVHCF
ncbi:hypothetical protein CPC16_006194 [Podila verticillata]|nr:hypothetical protein CPC16_006194 [Podila verticillata]